MAMLAENMSYDNLKEIVDALHWSCTKSPGSFDLTPLQMPELEGDSPGLHYLDVILDHPREVDFFALRE